MDWLNLSIKDINLIKDINFHLVFSATTNVTMGSFNPALTKLLPCITPWDVHYGVRNNLFQSRFCKNSIFESNFIDS